MKRPVGPLDLQAFVDGELEEGRLQDVRGHLLSHPTDAARVETLRRQNQAIRRAFDAGTGPVRRKTSVPASAPLRAGPDALSLERLRNLRRRRHAVATVAAFCAGAAVTFLGGVSLRLGPWPHAAAPASAPSSRNAEFAPAAARHARVAWWLYANEAKPPETAGLTSRIGTAIPLSRPPDFSSEGFRPVSGRVIPGDAAPASFLLFESEKGARLALLAERNGAGPLDPVLDEAESPRCLVWRAGELSLVLVGQVGPDALRRLASLTTAAVMP